MVNETETAEQARHRVLQGRLGSLAGKPTVAYLEQLRKDLLIWVEQVDAELHFAVHRETPSSEYR